MKGFITLIGPRQGDRAHLTRWWPPSRWGAEREREDLWTSLGEAQRLEEISWFHGMPRSRSGEDKRTSCGQEPA